MSRLMLFGAISWLMFSSPTPFRAHDAEDNPVKLVEELGRTVTRDLKLPGKPIIW